MLRALVLVLSLACAHSQLGGAQAALKQRTDEALAQMVASDKSLQPLLDRAAGYIVFPSESDAGVVYERGQAIGYAQLSQGSTHRPCELIVVDDATTLERMRHGSFDLSAEGVAVFVQPAELKASLDGQDVKVIF